MNLSQTPKNLARLSPSSSDRLNYLVYYSISMNLPMINEKIATPNKSIIEQTRRSTFVLGTKSPKPHVDKEVIAK